MGRNGKIQMVGSESDLNIGPRDMRSDAFDGGTVEFVDSEASLSRRTTPMGEFDKHVRGGRVDYIGSEVDFNRTPHRGWESYETPISSNSENSTSGTSGYPRAGKRGSR